MPTENNRIIIDTNLWISFLLTKDFSKLDHILFDITVVLLFSEELIHEFLEVADRPKFKKYFSSDDLVDVLKQISIHAELVNVTSIVTDCRDAKDNFLLSLAKDGNATHLITGDKDLLVLKKFNNTVITTIIDYLSSN